MKFLYNKFLIALIFTSTMYAQQINNTEFKTKTLQVYQNLDKNKVPHGILLDFGMEFTDLKAFNGTLSSSNHITSQRLSDIYKTLLMSRVRQVNTGLEARLLNKFYESLKKDNNLTPIENVTEYSVTKEQFTTLLKISTSDYSIAANNLMRMQLLAPAILKGGVQMGNEPMTIFKGIDEVTLTPLSIKFIEACLK